MIVEAFDGIESLPDFPRPDEVLLRHDAQSLYLAYHLHIDAVLAHPAGGRVEVLADVVLEEADVDGAVALVGEHLRVLARNICLRPPDKPGNLKQMLGLG